MTDDAAGQAYVAQFAEETFLRAMKPMLADKVTQYAPPLELGGRGMRHELTATHVDKQRAPSRLQPPSSN